ncbi:MAG: cytochrome c biogenesis CcdA family protein [Actinomycetota bacterium]
MGGLLTTGSILAAFFAGAVALFSPCCIVFLFPAYLASAVKNRRWKLLPLTLVFGAGIAVVLVPVTLGVGLLAAALARYHTPLYVGGGLLMLALAVLALIGRTWSMPSFLRAPSVDRSDTAGVFALGVFSGVASSCCAPVLAGVMALSALSGSLVGSTGLGFAYVFGMAFPLFVMALLWDRLHLGERRLFQARSVRLRVAGKTIDTNTVNIGVAIAFAAMGAFVLFLAANGNTTVAPSFQLSIGRWLSNVFARVLSLLEPVPQPILGIALLGLATTFVVLGFRRRRYVVGSEGGSCHDHEPHGLEAEATDAAPHEDETTKPEVHTSSHA